MKTGDIKMPAIKIHHTKTDQGTWDVGANTKKLRIGATQAYYTQFFAWRNADGDPAVKSSYKFGHHLVGQDGNIGAASTAACSSGIGVLNGGRGGSNIPDQDRRGVYNHLAAHLRDAGLEPPDLRSLAPDVETRQVPVQLATGADGQEGKLVGTAAVYNKNSGDLGGFTEHIEPGFFSEVLDQDVRALWNHNLDKVLGRTKNKTLQLQDGPEGLDIEIDPPNTTWGNDARTSIARGDVDQMSFTFRVRQGGDKWELRSDGTVHRTLLPGGCDILLDVSPVTIPAYPQTSINARAALDEIISQAAVNQIEDQEQDPDTTQEGGDNEDQDPDAQEGRAIHLRHRYEIDIRKNTI
jgi:HK97 family phage prohead protease